MFGLHGHEFTIVMPDFQLRIEGGRFHTASVGTRNASELQRKGPRCLFCSCPGLDAFQNFSLVIEILISWKSA
jgi:hypothetical protein